MTDCAIINDHCFKAGASRPLHCDGLADVGERIAGPLLTLSYLQLFALIYLQKFAIPVGTPVSLLLVLQTLFAAYMILTGYVRFYTPGLLAFLGFVGCCLMGQLQSSRISWPSLIQLVAINSAFVIVCNVSASLFGRILKAFQHLMLLPALIVLVQRVLLSAHFGDVLNLEKMAPKALMLPGYIYAAEFGWQSGVIRPNGFFFLEPSIASGFLAVAAVVEYAALRRLKWAAFYAVACLATYGSTGFVALGAFGVCVLARRSLFVFGAFAAITIGGLATAFSIPALSSMLRLDELWTHNSSGFGRLVLPPMWLGRLIMDGGYVFHGDGAGSVTEEVGSAWPIVKLTYEYGLAAAIAYAVFIVTNVSRASLPMLLAPLIVVYQFTGGYLVQPAWIGLVVLLCTLFVVSSSNKVALAASAGASSEEPLQNPD
jgi:hypothetical protein